MAYTRHMDVDDHNDNDSGDDGDSDLLAIGAAIRAALDKGVGHTACALARPAVSARCSALLS
jgi:hypothetical protein